MGHVRDVVTSRGIWSTPEGYTDAAKDKEVEWAWRLGQTIEVEARDYGYPVVRVQKRPEDVDAVLDALGL